MQVDKIPIIDSHLHIRRGIDSLDDLFSTIAKIKASCGLDAMNVASIPQWDKESSGQNLLCIAFKALNPISTYAYGGLDYFLPGIPKDKLDFANQAKRLLDMGFDGIKMVEGKPSVRKNIGDIPLNSKLYDDYYSYLESEGIPILLHVADPEENWDADKCPIYAKQDGWFYGEGTYPSKESLYEEVECILVRFPRLRIHLAHFYFMSADIDRVGAFLDKYPNISLDITPGSEMYLNFSKDPEKWHDFFTHYQDRILFGTDNGWGDDNISEHKIYEAQENVKTVRTFLETEGEFSGWGMKLKGICLDNKVLNKIYGDNFKRYAGDAPKRIDIALVKEYCEDMINLFSNNLTGKKVLEEMEFAFKILSKY